MNDTNKKHSIACKNMIDITKQQHFIQLKSVKLWFYKIVAWVIDRLFIV